MPPGSYSARFIRGPDAITLADMAFGGALAIDNTNLSLGTTTGVKIGTASTEKLGFYGATPIVRPAANPDTSAATLAALETEVNELKQLLRNLGLLTP